MTGRPSTYTDEIADEICEHIASGGLLVHWVNGADGRPGMSTIYRWLEAHERFREAYARAREVQAHGMAEQAVSEGFRAGRDMDPAAARVRFDAARWLAGKLAPRNYGEKVQNEISGPGGGPVRMAWGDGSQ